MFSSSRSNSQRRGCIRRHLIPDVSTQRNVLIFKVEIPKNRGCITRYLVPDVSTQQNVPIFKVELPKKRMHK
jgi:hypothetical protein